VATGKAGPITRRNRNENHQRNILDISNIRESQNQKEEANDTRNNKKNSTETPKESLTKKQQKPLYYYIVKL